MIWQLHWLEAEAAFYDWRPVIEAEIRAAEVAIGRIAGLVPLDVLIERVPERAPGRVIAELGMAGRAFRSSLFKVTVDPDNPNFASSLADGALRRLVSHEVHHCLRMGGPGYGRTLGAALVSEGLAGQFTRAIFHNAPEPWECGFARETLSAHFPDRDALHAPRYDHAAWFHGTGNHRPRWLGYALGYALVGDWIKAVGVVDRDCWINVPAATVLAAWGS